MLITKYKDRYGIVCLRCRLRHGVEAEDIESAYQAFLLELEKGEAGVGSRPLKDIKEEVSKEGADFKLLPQAVKALLMQKESYPVRYRLFHESEARYGRKVEALDLHPALKKFLLNSGINRLYEFQERAIELIGDGKNLAIVAPTASGKTEAFVLPIAQRILESDARGQVRALLVYPTKALARDQLKKFKKLEAATGIRFEVYDGDTPAEERKRIISSPPEVLVTNPDMLHIHLMRPGSAFRELILNIEYLVLDEIHEYTGAFGANVHFILKRLRRFCDFQVIGASATIGNPAEFASTLFDVDVEVVEESIGKKGPVHFLMLYPLGRSDTSLIIEALQSLVWDKYRVLVFANSHKNAEVLGRIAQKNKLRVAIHRAGLPKEYRHKAEDSFRSGELDVLVATPTLELGIDIGSVDAVVSQLVSFTHLIQRIGRAGRKGQESIAILALRGRDPISTYYRNYSGDYFTDIEPAYTEPKNEVVAYYQVLAGSMDKPLSSGELGASEIEEKLLSEGLLNRTPQGLVPTYTAKKALSKYNIRGIGDTVSIRDGNRWMGERSMPMAARELHPGALYLHAGKVYRGISFHFSHKVGTAQVQKAGKVDERTEALRYSQPEVIEVLESKKCFSAQLLYCKLRITEVVHSYVVKDVYSGKRRTQKALERPISYTFETRGLVFTAPYPEGVIKPGVKEAELLGGSFHAVEHVLIESSNMLVGGGSGEIGGISMGGSGTIFVYDSAPGGNGISKLLYDRFEEAVTRSLKILKECPCISDDGCPSCTYSYQCGNNNSPLLKEGAIASLELFINNVETEVDTDEYIDEKPYV